MKSKHTHVPPGLRQEPDRRATDRRATGRRATAGVQPAWPPTQKRAHPLHAALSRAPHLHPAHTCTLRVRRALLHALLEQLGALGVPLLLVQPQAEALGLFRGLGFDVLRPKSTAAAWQMVPLAFTDSVVMHRAVPWRP